MRICGAPGRCASLSQSVAGRVADGDREVSASNGKWPAGRLLHTVDLVVRTRRDCRLANFLNRYEKSVRCRVEMQPWCNLQRRRARCFDLGFCSPCAARRFIGEPRGLASGTPSLSLSTKRSRRSGTLACVSARTEATLGTCCHGAWDAFRQQGQWGRPAGAVDLSWQSSPKVGC